MNQDALAKLLDQLHAEATRSMAQHFIRDAGLREKIANVSNCASNRAGVRLLMACMLAKMDRPDLDPLKPYTEINTPDAFSGRTYDEHPIAAFINKYELPCNQTTAFLTPSLRNIDHPLSQDVQILGSPKSMYVDAIDILTAVSAGQLEPADVFREVLVNLLRLKQQRQARIDSLLQEQGHNAERLPLSSDQIIRLMAQHLACKHSSRLPVLMVAAAYHAARDYLREQAKPLESHNAADKQTGAMGDVEIALVSDDNLVTVYEMKDKPVTKDDVYTAAMKIKQHQARIDNYIFITTDHYEPDARAFAADLYENLAVEIAIMDCMGFIAHFLHLFHRIRLAYLDEYQRLVLAEPTAAVSQQLKEAFLTLRLAAESGE